MFFGRRGGPDIKKLQCVGSEDDSKGTTSQYILGINAIDKVADV